MLLSMRHIELHTVHSNADLDKARVSGLIDEEFALADCAGCAAPLGDNAMEFEPFVLCLDDENLWVVCLHCADNVLDPTTSDSAEQMRLVELDDDNFVLFDD